VGIRPERPFLFRFDHLRRPAKTGSISPTATGTSALEDRRLPDVSVECSHLGKGQRRLGPVTLSRSASRVIRDIRRKITDNETLKERFADLLALAVRVRFQDHRQRGPKDYALHAPEVECIGRVRPGRHMSSAARCQWRPRPPINSKGGQFVVQTAARFERRHP
jgi:hypothetical protein